MASDTDEALQELKLPTGWTFAALAAGIACGWALSAGGAAEPLLEITAPVGTLWLHALQITIVPLVAALLVTGTERIVETARGGAMARRTLLTFLAVLAGGAVVVTAAGPAALAVFPVPGGAAAALSVTAGDTGPVPGLGDFVTSLVAPNVVAAAAETAMLPLVVFFCAFGAALARLPDRQRQSLKLFFGALANVMLIIIGWVLWVAPVGVFALAFGVAARSGGDVVAALGHYIAFVASMGALVLLAAYAIAVFAGRQPLVRFAKAALPAQAVAISTQSSLASLPAMLGACRALRIRDTTADFVLPLAVALFRSTSPIMNLAVVIYIAKLAGVPLSPAALAAGALVAVVASLGTVSLPGTISFVTTIAPIALAMGVPVGPLALLVAVEMLPDIMRTVANVTADIAVTASIDQAQQED